MSDATISLRVDEHMHQEMKMHEEINWSAVLRKSISERLEELERIDAEKARKALASINSIRKNKVFDGGRNSTEIIREWREKRR